MPYYDYECSRCGDFDSLRPIAERNQPIRCPECGRLAKRVITAPHLNLMAPGRRDAFVRNEKSRHEPTVRTRHNCGSGCGCGKPQSIPTASPGGVDLGKLGRFASSSRKKRPWMLGH